MTNNSQINESEKIEIISTDDEKIKSFGELLSSDSSRTILKIGKTLVPPTHKMVHLILDDGRELFASGGHPTADGRLLGDLKEGDMLDNSKIKTLELVAYDENYTHDILPSGPTGLYWANGILLKSTIK